ncbi:MAG: methyltransferase [Rhodospirillaceae bacterium]|nr:methyltransferase [Rhodospirillaceae bacterium]|tara:strand:- start:10192 stop:10869 length:678 start_codon:yes stop_codon:yes gene_type:complete
MTSPLIDPALEALLDDLHARSSREDPDVEAYFARRLQDPSFSMADYCDDETHRFYADKMVALAHDKALFCYQLCRSLGARRIVEAGTSFGVSTLYLAAAIRDNGAEDGVVIATEHEAAKAAVARETFRQAGLSDLIDLREGDLRETLRTIDGPVDFMLVDIWGVAEPALRLVSPHLRQGAVVICDNTKIDRIEYDDYFAFVEDPANRFRTLTLPFDGGLEMTVRV